MRLDMPTPSRHPAYDLLLLILIHGLLSKFYLLVVSVPSIITLQYFNFYNDMGFILERNDKKLSAEYETNSCVYRITVRGVVPI